VVKIVHKFTETMTDVGEGVGGLTKGLYPVAALPIVFGAADMTTGVMKGVEKKVGKSKTKKKPQKQKSKKSKTSKKKKKKK
jgi:hypothetical protein